MSAEEGFEIAPSVVDLSSWSGFCVEGPDTCDFLNRLSSLNFKDFSLERLASGLFLNAKSGVIALGFFRKTAPQTVEFWSKTDWCEAALTHLEQLHFSETLQMQRLQGKSLMAWYGGSAPFGPTPNAGTHRSGENAQGSFSQWKEKALVDWVFTVTDKQAVPGVLKSAPGSKLHGPAFFEYHRTLRGVVWDMAEASPTTLALEASLDWAIDDAKGCYPGQEVVERIRSYGRVNRRVFPVSLSRSVAVPCDLKIAEEKVGTLLSAVEDPLEQSRIAGLALLQRKAWDEESALRAGSLAEAHLIR